MHDSTLQAAAVDTTQKKNHVDHIIEIIRMVGVPLRLHQINNYADSYGYDKISKEDINNAIKSKKVMVVDKNCEHVYYTIDGAGTIE